MSNILGGVVVYIDLPCMGWTMRENNLLLYQKFTKICKWASLGYQWVIISFAVHLLKIDARSFKNIFPSWLSLLYFNPHFERLCLCFLLLIIFEHSTDYRLVAWSLVKLSVDRSPYPYKRKGFRVKVYEKDVLFRGWNWAMRICESVARFDSSSCKKVEGIGGGSSYVVALCIPNYRKRSNRSIIWFYIPFIDWLDRIIFADAHP